MTALITGLAWVGHSSHRSLRRAALAIPLWLLAACAGPPDNLFVLLSNDDGSVGEIEIIAADGSRTLQASREATGADRKGETFVEPFEITQQELQAAFRQAFAAQPRAPRVFLLYFLPDSTELMPDSATALPEIVRAIAGREAPDISIVGHTDRSGAADYNLLLSNRRALAVRDELSRDGMVLDRIEVTSHGETNPLVATEDGVREPRNRRVEVTVR